MWTSASIFHWRGRIKTKQPMRLAKVEALPVIESPYVSSYLICIIKSDKTGTQYPFYSIGFV